MPGTANWGVINNRTVPLKVHDQFKMPKERISIPAGFQGVPSPGVIPLHQPASLLVSPAWGPPLGGVMSSLRAPLTCPPAEGQVGPGDIAQEQHTGPHTCAPGTMDVYHSAERKSLAHSQLGCSSTQCR